MARDTNKGKGRIQQRQDKNTIEKDTVETRFNVPQSQADERAKKERKIALDPAKAVIKALIEYQKDCQDLLAI